MMRKHNQIRNKVIQHFILKLLMLMLPTNQPLKIGTANELKHLPKAHEKSKKKKKKLKLKTH